MCSRTTCRACSKPDWRGCGAHIEQVLGDVPKQDRCRCREDGTRAAQKGPGASFLAALFGRK